MSEKYFAKYQEFSEKLRTLSKEELTSLLKEMRAINDTGKPAKQKQSSALSELMTLMHSDWSSWTDIFDDVNLKVKSEIIVRILNDKW